MASCRRESLPLMGVVVVVVRLVVVRLVVVRLVVVRGLARARALARSAVVDVAGFLLRCEQGFQCAVLGRWGWMEDCDMPPGTRCFCRGPWR